MKGKLLFVAGGVIGYVLGARAGRKRYEQIKQAASRVWESPAVQRQVHQVEDFASQKLGDVPEVIGDAAKKAVSGVVERVTSARKKPEHSAAGETSPTTGKSATGGKSSTPATKASPASSSETSSPPATGKGSGKPAKTDKDESL